MKNDLKVWRAKADVTQAELSDAVDVSRQTINAIERGRYDPSLELAFELAIYFECDIEDIFEYDPD
ncbi:helix-turn-helix transcriptional regulator [Natronoarchaeum rubrum]|uniref:helix-turn-helix transcriptional regulator n=1 Tax=Natronoarchaeum rubrum TaxID=755311 RepID=UPI00211233AF|nr:helix-turn-helix transcriptional regulator [Natronoarchaeum rubrum]HMB50263.1 helix-turn-helix transcriptional regulator [Natronoarchaeum rubrum]